MGRRKIPIMEKVEPVSTSAEVLAKQSFVYAVLARGLSQPDKASLEFLLQCGQVEMKDNSPVTRCLAELLESAQQTNLQEMQKAYMELFDPVNGPFPYESEHTKTHEFSKANILADIMGFYRAFGVEPTNDRADHISAELEFMHLLTVKEMYAFDKGEHENASICRQARESFFREHLGWWTDGLLKSLRAGIEAGRGKPIPFYGHLIELFQLFLDDRKESLS